MLDLTRTVEAHLAHLNLRTLLTQLSLHQNNELGEQAIELMPATASIWLPPVTITIPPMPLAQALAALCRQEHLRWLADAHGILIDRPLPSAQLQALVQALTAPGITPDAAGVTAAAAAAHALVRCGDRDGAIAVITALGNPALDQVPAAQRQAAVAYQQALIDALGNPYLAVDIGGWEGTRAWLVLGTLPAVQAAVSRAWARAAHQGLPYTPLLCYLAGAARLHEALPVLRQLAQQPEAIVSDLDPHAQRQAIALAEIRLIAVWALGALTDRDSVSSLEAMLRQQPSVNLGRTIVSALARIGDPTAADAVLAWSPGTEAGAQGAQYLALARLRPAALASALPPAAAAAPPTIPDGWWQAIPALPVAEAIPIVFNPATALTERNPWPRFQAMLSLVDRPDLADSARAAVRAQFAATSDAHLRQLDRILLAASGDAAAHAGILTDIIANPPAPDDWQPWASPLSFIGTLSPAEQDQLAASPAALSGSWDALRALGDRSDQLLTRLVPVYQHLPADHRQRLLWLLLDNSERTLHHAILSALTPPAGAPSAPILTQLGELPQWGMADPELTAAVIALLQHPDQAVANRAARWLDNDYRDDTVLVPLVAWEARQRLDSLPPELVRAAKDPWNVPGPLRLPMRLPYAVYDLQARLVLGWALTASDPAIRQTLAWWLGIHTEESQRPFRVAVVTGLIQLAADPDAGVGQQARDQLKAFLALNAQSREASPLTALAGAYDDRQALRDLDALVPLVQKALVTAPATHTVNPGF